MLHIRRMTQGDVAFVNHVQVDCYSPFMQEDEATIRARFLLAPDTAWVAEDEGGVCAYLVGYRSVVGKVTPLNAVFELPECPDALYLHDLAVAPRGKGRGIGKALVQAACDQAVAEGLGYAALVSVQNSKAFWERLGFAEWARLHEDQRENLHTYEGPAYYMVRDLR
ncbi:MAG TPA: GNAT family N-acetyltransferase [Symbiobacteriaceae bacterium]|nr:GNAT family N-acetyltransferase [Symbiobacteriaceae bacterium]